MATDMIIRARLIENGITEVKILMVHVMETGTRKNPSTKQLIPAHYITDVEIKLNATPVVAIQCAGGISKNPFFGFRITGAKARDFIYVSAVDNKGNKLEHSSIVI